MTPPPRDPKESILSPFLIWSICFVSLILVAGTFYLFSLERIYGSSIEMARTVAVNTLVAFEAFYLFNARYVHDSIFSREGIFGSGYVLGAVALVAVIQMILTYFSPM